jgi:hypothetical protein
MHLRYFCPACKTHTSFVRCLRCGNDTIENEETFTTPDATRNMLTRSAQKADRRRFTGEPITGFDKLR